LAGKPLIVYTIEAAQKASTLSRIVVSTDAEDIAEVALSCGVEVIYRPAHLAEDNSLTVPVIKHVLEERKNIVKPNKVVTLQPTSPPYVETNVIGALNVLQACR
jgi:CMP-N,N'-diacetyllegionaminic acid synthase